jgi:hypothetical protein
MKCTFFFTFIFLFTFLSVKPPAAALMVGMDTRQLTGGADLVIEGTVRRTSCFWNKDRTIIFTGAVVAVHQVYKGDYDKKLLRVDYPGGKIGDLRLGVTDAPRLRKGEHVILFLNYKQTAADKKRLRTFSIYGSAQGVYTIDQDGIAAKRGFSIFNKDHVPARLDVELPAIELLKKIRQATQGK